MKRTISTGLLFVFLINAVGFIVYLTLDWQEIRHEMTMMLSLEGKNGKLLTLHLPKDQLNQLTWVEPDHEFFYQEKLYDVSSLSKDEKGGLIIQCLEDKREAEFYVHMQNQSDPLSGQHHALLVNVFKFLSGLQMLNHYFPSISKPKGPKPCSVYEDDYAYTITSLHFQPPRLKSC